MLLFEPSLRILYDFNNNLILSVVGMSHRACKDQWTAESPIRTPCFLESGYVRPRVLCLAQRPIELQSVLHLTHLIQPKCRGQCLDALSFADRCLHQLLSCANISTSEWQWQGCARHRTVGLPRLP